MAPAAAVPADSPQGAAEPPLKTPGLPLKPPATAAEPAAIVITDADLADLPVSSSSDSSNAVAAPEPLFAQAASEEVATAATAAAPADSTRTADQPAAQAPSAINTSAPESASEKVPVGPAKLTEVKNLRLSVMKAAATGSTGPSSARQSMASPKLVCRVTGEAFTLKEDRQPVDMPCCGATVCVAAVKEVRFSVALQLPVHESCIPITMHASLPVAGWPEVDRLSQVAA